MMKMHSSPFAWHNAQSSSSLSLPSSLPPRDVLGPRESFQNLCTVVWHRSMLVSVVLNPDSILSSKEVSRVLYPSSRVPYSATCVLISPIWVPKPSSRVLIPWNWVVRYAMSWSYPTFEEVCAACGTVFGCGLGDGSLGSGACPPTGKYWFGNAFGSIRYSLVGSSELGTNMSPFVFVQPEK